MTDDQADTRSERAFREAFAKQGKEFEPVHLELPTRRGSWAMPLLVAAAVFAVLAGTTYLGVHQFTGGSGAPDDNVVAESPSGHRYESYRGVEVEVPDGWGYAAGPGRDWCAARGEDAPKPLSTPTVDTRGELTAVLLIACFVDLKKENKVFPGLPMELWGTRLSFEVDSPEDDPIRPEITDGDWTKLQRQVGRVVVVVTTHQSHLAESRRIIESARAVDVDDKGCAATHPIQAGKFVRPAAPFDVDDLEQVDEISVCHYALGSPEEPGLLASRRIGEAEVAKVLEAIQDAPLGGGPDRPATCVSDSSGSSALVLRLRSGDVVREMHVYYSTCRGNGFDDGTHLRELTRSACVPLWGERVVLSGGSSASVGRCWE